jgi:hypothetical protein
MIGGIVLFTFYRKGFTGYCIPIRGEKNQEPKKDQTCSAGNYRKNQQGIAFPD